MSIFSYSVKCIKKKLIILNDNNILRLKKTLNISETAQTILFLNVPLGGGATLYNTKRVNEIVESGFVAIVFNLFNLGTLDVYYQGNKKSIPIQSIDNLNLIFNYFNVKELFVNCIVSYTTIKRLFEKIKILKSKYNLKLSFPLHEYYCLCPRYKLLNNVNQFCYLPKEEAICNKCLLSSFEHDYKSTDNAMNIAIWRNMWHEFLSITDEILCFSRDSMALFKQVYPTISENKLKYVPHKVDDIKPINKKRFKEHTTLNIAALGCMNLPKGYFILTDLLKILESRQITDINIFIIGSVFPKQKIPDSPQFKVLGSYKREDLEDIIVKNSIDAFIIPSIWPETFSYTTEEVIKMDMPLYVFDIGAPPERVKHYSKGVIVNEISAKALLEAILKNRKVD